MKTPQQAYPELAKALGGPTIYLKREDQHPYGSHKGRSIPLMMKHYIKREDKRAFVISSSGNAALAAMKMAVKHNMNNPDKQITLRVFVGKKISEKKLSMLVKEIQNPDSGINIEQVEKPKQQAFQLGKSDDVVFLRQSTDDIALEGYVDLANELYKIPDLAAVFVPTSSGTTAQAIAETFATKNRLPQVHIVQTNACHPIADALGAVADDADASVAGAIVDNVAHRKQAVVDAVKKSSGTAWVPTDDEIKAARKLVRETTKIDISPNSALSVAGLQKALASGLEFDGPVVCLVTGA